MNGGVHGNIIKVLQSLYKNLSSAVISKNEIGEYFNCTTGTRQGCQMSPFFFIFDLGFM